MTPDQTISLAKQANVSIRGHYDETGSTPAELQRFAELVRNEVLEEAAQKCTEIALKPSNVILGVAVTCAEQIRSLKS